MFTDWLDAGPLDYSSLAGAFAPWARGAASDAQASDDRSPTSDSDTDGSPAPEEAAKKAAARAAPVEEPGQEVRQRRRLLPEWLKRTTQSEGEEAAASPATCTVSTDGSEVHISGPLIRVKGWWRKGPRFDQRFAEIRTGEKNQIELIWSRTEKGLKRIPLQGVTLEPFALEGLFGFRLLPLPQARAFWGSLVSVAGIEPGSFPQTVLLLASRSRGVGKCSVRLVTSSTMCGQS
ncbi:gms1 [Symbiodinium sp. CCMP2592]|nr:gms1 [Symbiodinium sp. CCMP2592]